LIKGSFRFRQSGTNGLSCRKDILIDAIAQNKIPEV
jgi:hypothetical protein